MAQKTGIIGKSFNVIVLVAIVATVWSFFPSPSQAEDKNPSWNLTKATPIEYVVVKADKDERKSINRTKLSLRIVPVTVGNDGKIYPRQEQNKIAKEQFAATVAAAAKYHARITGAHMVSVVLQTQFFPDHSAPQLATVSYAPDGKGVSGKDNWRWQMFSAAENGPTDAELKKEQLGASYYWLENAPDTLGDAVEESSPVTRK